MTDELPPHLVRKLSHVREHLIHSVDKKTQYPDTYRKEGFTSKNPMRGQCFPVSVVAQRELGGDIVRGHVLYKGKKESHYFNRIRWRGKDRLVDLSGEQYGYKSFSPATKLEAVVRLKNVNPRSNILLERYRQYQCSYCGQLGHNRRSHE